MSTLAVPSAPLTPDQYYQYASQDPGYLALQSSLKGNEDAYRANARGGINSGVISLGMVPTDSSLGGWLDSGTSAAAAANPLSTGAQLTTQHTNNMRGIQNSLAARGGYDSGELTYGLGNENQRDTQARADAMSKFMQYANGLFGNLGSMQAGDATQLGSELGNAAMRQLSLHPGSTTSATWDDATGTYVDGSGNHYDQYGNHIGTVGSTPTNFGPAVVNGATEDQLRPPPPPTSPTTQISQGPGGILGFLASPSSQQPITTQFGNSGNKFG